MATAPSPNDLTRQQLDELDALLQRMLNLPLTAVDPPPPAPAAGPPTVANWRADPPAPAPAPAPHLAPVELPRPPARVPRVTVAAVPTAVVIARTEAPPEPAVPVLAAPPAAELAPAPTREPMALAAADDAPIITPAALPSRVAGRSRSAARAAEAARPPAPPPPPAPAAPGPPSSAPHSAPRTPHPPLLWPLVAVDRVADVVFGLMGPPGWLLRTGFGKNLLGLAGLGLLLYTGAHLAAERGLLALPFPLPWPG